MSRTASAAVNYTLTNYAKGLSNDLMSARELINALVPIVQVSGASGQYKSFSDINSFQTYRTLRGMGGLARRMEFEASDESFVCRPHALEITVDDYERELSTGSLSNILLDEAKIKAVVSSAVLSHAFDAVTFVAANTTAVASRGDWTDATVDPIDEIDEQIINLMTVTGGFMPITVTMGLTAWAKLRKNAKVKARRDAIQIGDISQGQLSGLFIQPARVVVGNLSYNIVKPGNTVNKVQMMTDIVYISASLPNPTIYDPSPFKAFTTGSGGIESVRTYRSEENRADVHAVDWCVVFKLTSAASIIRLNIT